MKTLLTAADTAEELGITVDEICRLIRMGHIYAFNLGSMKVPRYYVRTDVLEEAGKVFGRRNKASEHENTADEEYETV